MAFVQGGGEHHHLLVLLCYFLAFQISVNDVDATVVASRRRPNFIVMQPDDMQFFEEWFPPGHIDKTSATNNGGQTSTTTNRGDGDGNSIYSMYLPNIERLRTNGLEMKRAYTASSMCGTSRYSTMTGRYPSRSSYSRSRNTAGMQSNRNNNNISQVTIPTTKLMDVMGVEDGLDCSQNNLAALLQRNGYKTGMFGKWHLYNTNQNNDEVYDYRTVQEEIQACGFDVAKAIYWQNLNDNWTNGGQFNHNMEHMTDMAIQFIDQATMVDDEQQHPFFLYFNPTAPHSSGNVYEALMEYSCMDAPEGRLTSEPSIPGMTLGVGCVSYRQSILDRSPDISNAHLGALWVDDAVGALLLHLETRGILNNTLFLFQLDHGQEAKSTLYEPGVRIPQFVHYPDEIIAGSTFEGLVSTIDIAPTLADYAGITTNNASNPYTNSSNDLLYAMDGWSWKSKIASSSSSSSSSSLSLSKEASPPPPTQGDDDDDERCILVELEQDRAVVCSCQKYMILSNEGTGRRGSSTFARGRRWGLANESPVSMNLCNNNDDEYSVTPNSSPETTTDDNGDFSRLQSAMDCLVEMTNPNKEVPTYGMCDALLNQDTTTNLTTTGTPPATSSSNSTQISTDNSRSGSAAEQEEKDTTTSDAAESITEEAVKIDAFQDTSNAVPLTAATSWIKSCIVCLYFLFGFPM